MEKPFEGMAKVEEAGFADDLRRFRLRDHGQEDWFGLVLLWVMAILVFIQFFSRYVLNDSVAWTEEVSRYLLMVLTFVGAAGAVRRGTHIRVEVLEHALPLPARRVLWVILDAGRLAFWVFGAVVGFDLADRMGEMPMDSFRHGLGWVYWPIFLGFVAMALREAQWIWRRWRHGDAPNTQQVIA